MSGEVVECEWLRKMKASALSPRSREQHLMYLGILKKLAGKPLDVVVANPRRMAELMRANMTVSSRRAASAAVRALGKHGGLPAEYSPILEEWGKIHAEASRNDIERARQVQPEQPKVSVADVLAKEQQLARESPGSDEHLLLAAGAANLPRFVDLSAVSLGRATGELGPGEVAFVGDSGDPKLMVRPADGARGVLDLGATPRLCEAVGKSLASRPRRYLFLDSSGSPFSSRKAFLKWASTRLASAFGGKKLTLLDVHKAFNKEGVGVGPSTLPAPQPQPQPHPPHLAKKEKSNIIQGQGQGQGQGSSSSSSPAPPIRGIHVQSDGSLTVVL